MPPFPSPTAYYYTVRCGHCGHAVPLADYAEAQAPSTRAPSAAHSYLRRAACGRCGERYAAASMAVVAAADTQSQREARAAGGWGKRRRIDRIAN